MNEIYIKIKFVTTKVNIPIWKLTDFQSQLTVDLSLLRTYAMLIGCLQLNAVHLKMFNIIFGYIMNLVISK